MNENCESTSLQFPATVIFKSIFRNKSNIQESLKTIFSEYNIDTTITSTASENGKFISFTLEAEFPSNDILNVICTRIKHIEGFMTMF